VWERSNFDAEAASTGDGLRDRLNARARRLIETPSPSPLPDDVLAELAAMERAWLEQAGG
jgi:hypothetical protein